MYAAVTLSHSGPLLAIPQSPPSSRHDCRLPVSADRSHFSRCRLQKRTGETGGLLLSLPATAAGTGCGEWLAAGEGTSTEEGQTGIEMEGTYCLSGRRRT